MSAISVLKKISTTKYKYFVLVVVFGLAITLVGTLGQEKATASSTAAATPIAQKNTTQENLQQLAAGEVAQVNPGETTGNGAAETTGTNTGAATTGTSALNSSRMLSSPSYLQANANLGNIALALSSGLITTSSQQIVNGQIVTKTEPGAIGSIYTLMGSLYKEKPASVEVWAQDLRSRVDPTVYAQSNSETYNPGSGYNLLRPILSLWQASRNVVYVLYIVILVAISFLIVFRNKLGGKESVTLFNALPSIVISLLLVTFSYPLSAIFIDFITVGSGVVYGTLVGGADSPGAFLRTSTFKTTPVAPQLPGSSSISSEVDATKDLQIDDKFVSVWWIFGTSGIYLDSTAGAGSIVPQDVPIISEGLSQIINSIAGGSLPSILLTLVFAFAAFSASINVFFKLLKEYVMLTIYPLASPFIFLLSAIPGQESQISKYFARLLAASLSFISVYAIFLIAIIIARDGVAIGDIAWTPPLLGYGASQGAGQSSLVNNIIRPLLAYAMIISAPILPDLIVGSLAKESENIFVSNLAKSTKGGATQLLGALKGINNIITGPGALDVASSKK